MRVFDYYQQGISMEKLYDKLRQVRSNAVLSTAKSQYLTIDNNALEDFAKQIASSQEEPCVFPITVKGLPLDEQIGITLMFGAINYCFVDPSTGVDYAYSSKEQQLKRSTGLIYALVSSGLDWSDFNQISRVSHIKWRKILHLDDEGTILYDAEERIRRLHVFSTYLSSRVADTANFFDHFSSARVYMLLQDSKLFEDIFCKRLQIVLLWLDEMANAHRMHFDLERGHLTAMADYRLPQIMCHLGIIKLNEEAVALLNHKVIDIQFEHDMRSAAVDVCYRVAKATSKSEACIDSIFWALSQDAISDGLMKFPAMRVATRSY